MRLWGLPAAQYVATTGAPSGWAWLGRLASGDYLNLLGIALFIVVPIAAYARLAGVFMREGKRAQAMFALLQVLVLLAAASGLIR